MNTQQWRIPAHVPQNHGCRSLDASRTVANLLAESDGLKHPPLGGESGAGNSLKHSGLENLFHDLRRCSKIPRCILPFLVEATCAVVTEMLRKCHFSVLTKFRGPNTRSLLHAGISLTAQQFSENAQEHAVVSAGQC